MKHIRLAALALFCACLPAAAQITTIQGSDTLSESRTTINNNFSYLATQLGLKLTSPLTTKGDLIVHNGTAHARLAVGANDYCLVADSTTATGLAWKVCGSGTGDFSSNTSTSVDGEVVLFSGTGGKTGKRATGTGFAKLTSGVLSAADIDAADVPDLSATYQPTDADLAAIAALGCSDGQIIKRASGVWACGSDDGGTGSTTTVQAGPGASVSTVGSTATVSADFTVVAGLAEPSNEWLGKHIYAPSAAQTIDATSDTILANATTVRITAASDYTLCNAGSAIILDGTEGQILTIANVGSGTVTLSDQDTCASSNLKLGASTVAITPHLPMFLQFLNGVWRQVGGTGGTSSSSNVERRFAAVVVSQGNNSAIPNSNGLHVYLPNGTPGSRWASVGYLGLPASDQAVVGALSFSDGETGDVFFLARIPCASLRGGSSNVSNLNFTVQYGKSGAYDGNVAFVIKAAVVSLTSPPDWDSALTYTSPSPVVSSGGTTKKLQQLTAANVLSGLTCGPTDVAYIKAMRGTAAQGDTETGTLLFIGARAEITY